jgi:hypothetical protein
MQVSHLGPHSFLSDQPHGHHDAWLKAFTAKERHDLIAEDIRARTQAATVMACAMGSGIVMAVILYLVAL